MIRIRAIDHIVLRTAQPAEMIGFYRDVLGCTLERTLPAEVGLYQLRAGNALIDLVGVDSQLGRAGGPAPSAEGNNMDHFCLQIAPFEESELIGHLSRHGVGFSDFATRYGAQGFGRSVYIEDPDGNTIELRARKSRDQGTVLE
jgi:catechol 2,3-dioxygenase-like lactoylglutathione lyase family enzyme